MISPRKNLLETIYGGKPEYVPLSLTEIQYVGAFANNVTEMPMKDGNDIFGCPWVVTNEGGMNKTGFVMFDDITEWEDYVKIPDISDIDYNALAEQEFKILPDIDRKNKMISFMDAGGAFMRLLAFMGFENCLCALAEDPETCMDFFEAYTNFKIKFINKVIDAYNPDIYVQGEDIATARSLFMSPETYRKVLKPFHKRIAEAVTKRGVIFDVHCCGKCEEVVPDYIEIGAKIWQSAQIMNDLPEILEKYKGQIALEGGWDTSGKASYLYPDTSEEVLREEVRRCLSNYKKPGYILWPLAYNDDGHIRKVGDRRLPALIDEWEKNRWF